MHNFWYFPNAFRSVFSQKRLIEEQIIDDDKESRKKKKSKNSEGQSSSLEPSTSGQSAKTTDESNPTNVKQVGEINFFFVADILFDH